MQLDALLQLSQKQASDALEQDLRRAVKELDLKVAHQSEALNEMRRLLQSAVKADRISTVKPVHPSFADKNAQPDAPGFS